jgi:hypothetical protein
MMVEQKDLEKRHQQDQRVSKRLQQEPLCKNKLVSDREKIKER